MDARGDWDLFLQTGDCATICLCESVISLTLCSADEDKDLTLHLDPVSVGQLAGLLLSAGAAWLAAAKESLEQAAEPEEK